MKHIKTTHEEESKAKKEFSAMTPENDSVVASNEVEHAVRTLYAMMVKADIDALEMSRLRGVIMRAMGKSAYLKSKEGIALCSWISGNATSSTDWKGLCEKYKVKPEDIHAYTSTSVGSRRFSIELEG